MAKTRVNYTLSPEAKWLIEQLARRLGVSQSTVLEFAVRDFAAARGMEPPVGNDRES